ncbi:MAG: hypothetical protein QOJ65_1548 [Fimbriimonadaceae bacterium]|jgi:hypothetical protein|nr:hypothetical protein [Fimbriimonadaceae bacterium]
MSNEKLPSPVDLILETSSILFLCGAAIAVFSLRNTGVFTPIPLIVATSLPAAASLLLLVAALIMPGIYAVRKMSFPLNLTLPVIHCSLIFMLAELTRGSFGLINPPDALKPALMWEDPRFLGMAFAAQVILLSGIVAVKNVTGPRDPAADVQR